MSGVRQEDIAEQFGLSQPRVSEIICNARARVRPDDRQALIEREMAFLDELRREAMEIAGQKPAPVTAGKDGEVVTDPETGEVVRDHSGRLAAMARAQATSADLRKLLGLDAPARTEVSGGVRYEIVGVDPEAIA